MNNVRFMISDLKPVALNVKGNNPEGGRSSSLVQMFFTVYGSSMLDCWNVV